MRGCARRKSVKQYLDRFGFKSPLVKAMYAGTDGISGFSGDWNDPGTGANFLLHQMVRPSLVAVQALHTSGLAHTTCLPRPQSFTTAKHDNPRCTWCDSWSSCAHCSAPGLDVL